MTPPLVAQQAGFPGINESGVRDLAEPDPTKHSSTTCQVNLIAHTASLRQVIPRTSSPGVSITDRLERDSTIGTMPLRCYPCRFLDSLPEGRPRPRQVLTFPFSDALRVKAGNRNTRPVYIVVSIG